MRKLLVLKHAIKLLHLTVTRFSNLYTKSSYCRDLCLPLLCMNGACASSSASAESIAQNIQIYTLLNCKYISN